MAAQHGSANSNPFHLVCHTLGKTIRPVPPRPSHDQLAAWVNIRNRYHWGHSHTTIIKSYKHTAITKSCQWYPSQHGVQVCNTREYHGFDTSAPQHRP